MSRPLDLVYFMFFLLHIPATLFIDLQALYPPSLVPRAISGLPQLYIRMSGDPLVGGVMGLQGQSSHFIWFKSFLVVEAFFQLPVFVLGARGLWTGSHSIYILLLIYAASTTTTTLPCLSVLLYTPITSPQTVAQGVVSISFAQRLLLLTSYLPFFFVPLVMTFDMASRVLKLANVGAAIKDAEKAK
ncbi:hypothetical protein SERLA73DRAFT_140397 [Serpula lacrymans var. lacrymans S7.3]|uniref:Efficient mitochondria targeting-associated protein 19 n=2 Tax=Serpula lacrymans var. lacrymans TaxID=341189 RepID=F8Q571_SERL3|nr:uncharacterized protein SERLADRAFT_395330 [Serpula lacrymans var. lacrymans S7.9]EGN96698.1 hypothetical protein SERLA73DRAFT_140397 [Serpula lacrymans var. lacrymans S7.3]EGO22312.1 hypothetical protein SERLADRAFT_395330 [Serpula lacrymans var. lacrymans S7.9]